MFRKLSAAAVAVLAAGPAVAQSVAKPLCCGRKIAMTFGDASPDVKLMVLVLGTVAIASVVVWIVALRRIRRERVPTLPRTLAFLSAWRAGGPLLGAAWAGKIQTEFWVGVYAYPPVTDLLREAFAPGMSEVAMLLWAGFTAGALAALTGEHLKGRLAAMA